MPDEVTANPTAAEQDVVNTALDRFDLAAEADSTWRELCLDDLEFSVGNQWPLNIKTQREAKNKPCLVMDQIQQSVRLTCNEYRQQRPAITVDPVGSDSDVDTAEILQGIIRHIEVISDGEIAYDNAHEQVVRSGLGNWRILNDWADDDSEEQEVRMEPIRNQFSVYWQPGVPHNKAKWCFLVEDMPSETYDDEYGGEGNDSSGLQGIGNAPAEWITKEYVRVAEYFEVKEVSQPHKKRPKRQVKWRKINAFEILDGGVEGKDLPGSSIPILTAYGDDIDVNGKRYIAGLVRNAKGPQRMYNYFCSAATQTIALAPVAPVRAAEGTIAGYEKLWERANTGDVAVLHYKLVDVNGKPAPPPDYLAHEPPIQAMQSMIQQAAMDLRAATGLYDPSLGQRKGDESGKAIERLQSQGDVATFNYSDNMAREMRRCGRLLIEWIRAIYDTPRVQRIIKPDGSVSQVVIHNGPEQKPDAEKLLGEKIKKIYDIGVGQYDVAIDVGPSYKTKRQEAVATQLDFLKMLPPQIAQNYIDLVTANMDWPQAQEYSKRAKKMLPPGLADDDGDPETQLNDLKAQVAQMTQQFQLQHQVLQKQDEIIKTKQIENQGKLQIEQVRGQNDLAVKKLDADLKIALAEIQTKAQIAIERASALQEVHSDLHESAHEAEIQAQQHAHEKEMAAQQAAAAQQQQQSDQGHELGMAAMQPQPTNGAGGSE